MATTVPTSMLKQVASIAPALAAAGDVNKVLQLDANGLVPAAYITDIGAANVASHQWRYTTAAFATGTSDVFIDTHDGWEQVDTTTQAINGDPMTVTEGVFTFPSTGTWLVRFTGKVVRNSSDVSAIAFDLIATSGSGGTTDNHVAQGSTSVSTTATNSSVSVESLVDVTATADVKVKIRCGAHSSGADVQGHTAFNRTYFTFLRVGPT
jgi:hypothetical protein